MTRVSWGTMEEMGDDTSAYMAEIVGKLREMLPQLGEALLPLYVRRTSALHWVHPNPNPKPNPNSGPNQVRWFCDKLVASLVPRLIGSNPNP